MIVLNFVPIGVLARPSYDDFPAVGALGGGGHQPHASEQRIPPGAGEIGPSLVIFDTVHLALSFSCELLGFICVDGTQESHASRNFCKFDSFYYSSTRASSRVCLRCFWSLPFRRPSVGDVRLFIT